MRRKLMQNAVPKIRRRRIHIPASSKANTIRSRKGKPRHKVRRHVDAISNIVLLGDSNRVVEIEGILSSLATDILSVKSKEDATSLANARTLAFIVVEPMDFRSMTRSTLEICEELVEYARDLDIPVLAIISDERQTLLGRALLEAGVAEVFAYPLERFELPRLVSQAIGLASSVPNMAKSDRQIRDAVEEAITSDTDPIGNNIKVAVSNGIVSLYGSLDAYWKMKYTERIINFGFS